MSNIPLNQRGKLGADYDWSYVGIAITNSRLRQFILWGFSILKLSFPCTVRVSVYLGM